MTVEKDWSIRPTQNLEASPKPDLHLNRRGKVAAGVAAIISLASLGVAGDKLVHSVENQPHIAHTGLTYTWQPGDTPQGVAGRLLHDGHVKGDVQKDGDVISKELTDEGQKINAIQPGVTVPDMPAELGPGLAVENQTLHSQKK